MRSRTRGSFGRASELDVGRRVGLLGGVAVQELIDRLGHGLRVRAHVLAELHLVLVLDADDVVHDVVDLLIAERAREPDAPRRHQTSPLLDRRVDVVQAVDQWMTGEGTAADRGQVRRRLDVVRVVGGLRVRDQRPLQGRPVALNAADASLVHLRVDLDGVRAAGDRVVDQVLLLVEVLLGFQEPDGRHPDHEEQDEHDAPSLKLLQQRGLEVGVGGARPHRVRDVGMLSLAAAEDEHASGDRDEDGAADRKDDALGLGQPEHHCTATQNGPAKGLWVVSVPRGGPRTISAVSTRTSPLSVTVTLKRSMPCGAGPSLYSPAVLYFDPWHGHSNHCDCWQNGTRHPRCTHRWYSGMIPWAVTPSVA